MRSRAIWPSVAAGALCAALAFAGCDDGASPLAGTWVRSRAIGADSDTWKLTLRDDGTYSMSHEHLENGVSTTTMFDSAREGDYTVGDDGRVSFSGGWMSDASGVTSLEDVAASYDTLSQESMYMLDESGNALFIGPDFNADSAYTAGDSYDLAFPAGDNSYARDSSLALTDGEGQIVERRDESYTYTFIDATHCAIQYAFATDPPTASGEGEVTADDCTYDYSDGQEVVGLDGATALVPLITFSYTLDGESRTDYFAMFNGALISYTPSLLSEVLSGNAYFKSAD